MRYFYVFILFCTPYPYGAVSLLMKNNRMLFCFSYRFKNNGYLQNRSFCKDGIGLSVCLSLSLWCFTISLLRGGERMCHFLKPLKLTQELSQEMSYRNELWYGSFFYNVYSGTAKKRRRNRRCRRKPPSAAEFFFCYFSLN